MSAHVDRHQVVTFKADEKLLAAMADIPNRSEFIRSAILAALDGVCPLCHGNGVLSPSQRRHWKEFARSHVVTECGDCKERHLVCATGESEPELFHGH